MSHEYVKISELDPTSSFGSTDQFVIVQNDTTVKISGVDLIDSLVTQANLASRSFVTAIVDTAPETLNTLKELANALNDDANFAVTVSNLISTKLNTTDFGLHFWNEVAELNTYHIVEGSNLYFTQNRARQALSAGEGIVYDNTTGIISVTNNGTIITGSIRARYGSFFGPSGFEFIADDAELANGNQIPGSGTGIKAILGYRDENDTVGYIDGMELSSDGRIDIAAGLIQINTDGGGRSGAISVYSSDIYLASMSNKRIVLDGGIEVRNGNIKFDDGSVQTKAFSGSYNDLTDKPANSGGSYPPTPTFTTVTTTQLNVQNIDFTGTGAVTFESGNDLNFVAAGDITFNGDTVITKSQLKSIVAASVDFADFKARIAAL